MPPIVIDVRRAEDLRDVVHRAVQALVEGDLVVFPTETVYGVAASALNEQAVDRLLELKTRGPEHPLTLAIKSAEDAWDYVPRVPDLGRRLARRCWPGPVTLVIKDDHSDSLLHQLPPRVRTAVASQGTVGLRVPAHHLITDVLELLAGPLTLTSANRAGDPPAITAEQVVLALGDKVRLILDDGQCRFGQASSVVQVDEHGMKVLRAGVVTETTLNRLASVLVVLVCTGNTCRSPMAELLMQKQLAEKIGCLPAELEDRGVLVVSAGLAAMSGASASPEAVDVMKQRGMDLSGHISQPLTDRLVDHADLILTMTRGHLAGVVAQWPSAASRALLLSPEGRDVADPIGGPLEMYQRCAEQIDSALAVRVRELRIDDR